VGQVHRHSLHAGVAGTDGTGDREQKRKSKRGVTEGGGERKGREEKEKKEEEEMEKKEKEKRRSR
jgi:hypothetical protein